MTHSPVFVATFNDDTQTRMTVWHDPECKALNLDRGIRLAQHAYRSRKGQEPPLIVAGRFECNGLASYTASEVVDDNGGRAYRGSRHRTCGGDNSAATAAIRRPHIMTSAIVRFPLRRTGSILIVA
jgi:hypothetical protein